MLLLLLAALQQSPLEALRNVPKAQVLILGTFHFQDAGRDTYKPQFPYDIRTPEHQKELDEVLAKIIAWGPTRIAVERDVEVQSRVDSLFAIYPGNGMDTLKNEIYQVGFKLAKRLKHAGVFAVDADARFLDSAMTEAEWKKRKDALTPGPLSGPLSVQSVTVVSFDGKVVSTRTILPVRPSASRTWLRSFMSLWMLRSVVTLQP